MSANTTFKNPFLHSHENSLFLSGGSTIGTRLTERYTVDLREIDSKIIHTKGLLNRSILNLEMEVRNAALRKDLKRLERRRINLIDTINIFSLSRQTSLV